MTVLHRVVFYVVIIYNSLFSALYLVYQDFHSQSWTVFCLFFFNWRLSFLCFLDPFSHSLSPSQFSQFPLFFFIFILLHFFLLFSPIPCDRRHSQLELRTYSTIRNLCPAFSAKQIIPSLNVTVVLPRFCLRFRTRIFSYLRPLNPDKWNAIYRHLQWQRTVLSIPQVLQDVIWWWWLNGDW
jgi:hypothetical protein